ncbi:aldehyde ferredoxin oxidoreductase family protein [Desulfurispora thermophila]|uniref:aldehyde ferredoxin oxidoreductase family protein n=1 Tax=Desulfurispora thermophila TaxID=265470 RepID=UPI0003707E26|nr:aldehyde ferredoxin oxidoreductase family protein [Desulfurispora thermophila]
MHGYMGKIAFVDLNREQVEIRELDPALARNYLGGSALAARLFLDLGAQDAEPLAPENPLIFMTGPLVGTVAPSASRFAVCARSPLTGIWGEATSGGVFGVRLKMAGLDGLVITGRAAGPVYLHVTGGQVSIQPADKLWGLDSYATQQALKAQHPRASVACIGPAGEKLVPMAAVMNDAGRAAGRCGLGAVMGSKNLKAVVAEGQEKVTYADFNTFKMVSDFAAEQVRQATGTLRHYGTLGYLDVGFYFGDVPARYYTAGIFPAEKVTGKRLREDFVVKNSACFGCQTACGRRVKYVMDGQTVSVDGPEYETVVAFGPLCDNYDLASVIEINHLCNRLGLDTISAGASIAFAMYLQGEGLVPAERFGRAIPWGDAAVIKQLVEDMAYRRGCGQLLGQGTRVMAAALGVDPELAAQVKGLEMPMHDPRAFAGQALSYATGPRGACHLRGDFYLVDLGLYTDEKTGLTPGPRHSLSGRVDAVITLQNIRELDNSLLRCVFASLPVDATAGLLGLLTGQPWTVEDLLKAGERSFNLKRLLNNHWGVTAAGDRLPRILSQAYADGGAAGQAVDLTAALVEYYALRGWDGSGRPDANKLAELGLGELAGRL